MTQKAYAAIIEAIFFAHYRAGETSFEFERAEIAAASLKIGAKVPSNIGDVLYSFRYRRPLPAAIVATCPDGKEWVIETLSAARYRFRLAPLVNVRPRIDLYVTKIPDATPQIVETYALDDEQALLAKLRYNRLIDIFTGLTTYSLQNHLRTQVDGVQLEIDELYVGLSKSGAHFVIPVQAKGGTDKIGRVQIQQDALYCNKKFPGIQSRQIAAQFMADGVIALLEILVEGEEVSVVDERHYKLVPRGQIWPDDLATMAR